MEVSSLALVTSKEHTANDTIPVLQYSPGSVTNKTVFSCTDGHRTTKHPYLVPPPLMHYVTRISQLKVVAHLTSCDLKIFWSVYLAIRH